MTHESHPPFHPSSSLLSFLRLCPPTSIHSNAPLSSSFPTLGQRRSLKPVLTPRLKNNDAVHSPMPSPCRSPISNEINVSSLMFASNRTEFGIDDCRGEGTHLDLLSLQFVALQLRHGRRSLDHSDTSRNWNDGEWEILNNELIQL